MRSRGAIAWFVRHHIASNLMMLCIVIWGAVALVKHTQFEIFPELSTDQFHIETALEGASQTEVDERVSQRIGSAMMSLGEIDSVRSYSTGNFSRVIAELNRSADPAETLEQIKNKIDQIDNLPDSASRPQVSLQKRVKEVIGLAVWGETEGTELLRLAERVRNDLLQNATITHVEIQPNREHQIVIEVPERALQKYSLTMEDVALAIQRGSSNSYAGSLESNGRTLQLRATGQAYDETDFSNLPVIVGTSGAVVRLGEVANIYDELSDDSAKSQFNGKQSLMLQIYRVGDQSAIDISESVLQYVEDAQAWIPEGANLSTWRNMSEVLQKRIHTMTVNMLQGGILVLILLSLFLRPTISFWVSMSIPITFIGAIGLMSVMGVSINVVTLFAFILVLGFVVDDAIVTGENIHTHLEMGKSGEEAAIDATYEVSVPVTFGILTTIAAFIPLSLDPSMRGQLFAQIPAVVIPVLILSWIMSKLIIPARLKNMRSESNPYANKSVEGVRRFFRVLQKNVSGYLEHFTQEIYKIALAFCIKHRYATVATVASLFMITCSMLNSGHIKFLYFPKVPAETVIATIQMPPGSSANETSLALAKVSDSAEQLRQTYRNEETGQSDVLNIFSSIGNSATASSSRATVMIELRPPEERVVDTETFMAAWSDQTVIPHNVLDIHFTADALGDEPSLEIFLNGHDPEALKSASALIENHLALYPEVFSIRNSAMRDVKEISLTPLPQAGSYPLTVSDIAHQVRQSFHGSEIQRLQRAGEDVSVVLRKPAAERQSLDSLNDMSIRTPSGSRVVLSDVATLDVASKPEIIERVNQRQTVRISAEADRGAVDLAVLKNNLVELANEITANNPGLHFSIEGESAQQELSTSNIRIGMFGTLIAIYVLLAIPFRSYSQPFVVMSVIPFGLIGAVIGHELMGLQLSFLSILGIVALAGIGVNDSLVLVDYINQQRRAGVDVVAAAKQAGLARFRPVLLTSLTTFCGFAPLMFETSTQAKWLVPMAVSLGFGILFASMITLVVIPCNYIIARDIKIAHYNFMKRLRGEHNALDVQL